MDIICQNGSDNYEFSEQQYEEIRIALLKIMDWIDIMHNYCEHNIENSKICPLLTLIEQIKEDSQKITDKF